MQASVEVSAALASEATIVALGLKDAVPLAESGDRAAGKLLEGDKSSDVKTSCLVAGSRTCEMLGMVIGEMYVGRDKRNFS